MKLRCKIFPMYFQKLAEGKKRVDYRQFESITFVNSMTGEEIEFDVQRIEKMDILPAERIKAKHQDVAWEKMKPIYRIVLGKGSKNGIRTD